MESHKNRKRKLKFGKHVIPVPLMAFLLIVMISSGALGYYLYSSFTVPTVIKEPIEIVRCPSQWNLYPGENQSFTVTVNNHASLNYTVVMDFSSNDTTYQSEYLTFSNKNYTVVPGQQDLASWFSVNSEAPAANLSITVTISRGINRPISGGPITNGNFETGSFLGWSVNGVCSISGTVVHSGRYSAYISDQTYDDCIGQMFEPMKVPLSNGLKLDAWVNPSMVGGLPGDYPASIIILNFYDTKTDSYLIPLWYSWSYPSYDPAFNVTQTQNPGAVIAFTFPNWNVGVWNELQRNVTADVYSFYGQIDLSGVYLASISIQYHYSNGSPGAFYVDDIMLST